MPDPVIIPGRAAPDGITWWTLARATAPAVRLVGEPQATVTVHPLEALDQGMHAFLLATTNLAPDRRCTLEVTDAEGTVARAASRTLPAALTPGTPFTIALGSCYNWPMDIDEAGRWFPPKAHAPDGADPLRLGVLLGDQVYMDLKKSIDAVKEDSWSEPMPKAPDPWKAYQQQWSDRRHRNLLGRAGCGFLCLADDHEMWNDWPHRPLWLGWTKGDEGRALERELLNAFDVFQAALNLPPGVVAAAGAITHTLIRAEGLSFSFDVPPLSFFVFDTRIGRTRADTPGAVRFTDPAHLQAAVNWLHRPGGLGILAVAAPVFQGRGSAFDHNLADYEADYRVLVDALNTARRPVIVLSGDIHRSRLYALFLGTQELPTALEFVSSPFSRLKEPPGIDPPSGEPVVQGILGESGARFKLANTDPGPGGPRPFVTTARQTYGTISFTSDGGNGLATVLRCWGRPVRQRDGAALLLQHTRTWAVT